MLVWNLRGFLSRHSFLSSLSSWTKIHQNPMQSSREGGPMSPKDRWPTASCFLRVSLTNANQDILGWNRLPHGGTSSRWAMSPAGSCGSGEMTKPGLGDSTGLCYGCNMHPWMWLWFRSVEVILSGKQLVYRCSKTEGYAWLQHQRWRNWWYDVCILQSMGTGSVESPFSPYSKIKQNKRAKNQVSSCKWIHITADLSV